MDKADTKKPHGKGLQPWIASLASRVAGFRRDLLVADTWQPAARVGVELDRALEALEIPPFVPALVVMLGGTGVGKSELFNALVDRPGASPSSDTVRCHTSQPHLAVNTLDRAHLPTFPGLEPVIVEGGVPRGIVLADTPDIDGMIERHHGVTRLMLERADLVLFVTDPDRRANLQVLEELRRWAPRKRWLFVLTKSDKYPDTIQGIAGDFNKRLAQIGFPEDAESRFVVSSIRPTDPGLGRLRQTVLRPGDENRMPLLRQDAFLRQSAHALSPSHLQPFGTEAEKLGRLAEESKKLQERAYLEALSEPRAADAFARVVRQAAWKELGDRSGPFLFPAIWARARMQPLATGWALTRGLRGGLLGIAGALGASAVWALRGLSPLRHIALALGDKFRTTLETLDHDARRALEDAGLDRIDRQGTDNSSLYPEATRKDGGEGLGGAVDQFLKQWTLSDLHPGLLERVEGDVDTAGRESARLTTSGPLGALFVLAGNLLVAGMIGWVVYRLGKAWWLETELSTSFFLLAAMLVLASFLPGLLALGWRLSSLVNPRRLQHLVNRNPTPVAGGQLERVRKTMAGWYRSGGDIARSLEEAQTLLRADLGAEANWGASIPSPPAKSSVSKSME